MVSHWGRRVHKGRWFRWGAPWGVRVQQRSLLSLGCALEVIGFTSLVSLRCVLVGLRVDPGALG